MNVHETKPNKTMKPYIHPSISIKGTNSNLTISLKRKDLICLYWDFLIETSLLTQIKRVKKFLEPLTRRLFLTGHCKERKTIHKTIVTKGLGSFIKHLTKV